MPDIFVDADACPVKQEVYRVAKRHGLKVVLVSNSWMRTPREGGGGRLVARVRLSLAPRMAIVRIAHLAADVFRWLVGSSIGEIREIRDLKNAVEEVH